MVHFLSSKAISFLRCGRIILLSVLCVFLGCKKDKLDFPQGTNESVNKWILDSMKVYYYWNSSFPNKPIYSQEPLTFFSALKNPDDRFSLLVNPSFPDSYGKTLSVKFGLDIIYVINNSTAQAVVTLVIPGLQADENGIKRGEIIKSINAVIPDQNNIQTLINSSIRNNLIRLQIEGRSGEIVLKPPSFAENPLHKFKIINHGGKKIAYLFLNSFDEAAVPACYEAFSWFKEEAAVTELILDLRYNRGGYVSASAGLAAMIAPVGASDAYTEYRGNNRIGIKKRTFNDELSFLSTDNRMSFSQLKGVRAMISRIYILTGQHTASAAELLINNLTPYITVVKIGERTLGKDMASFLIKDERKPVQVPLWEIYPLVYKLYNKQGKGDYAGGISPDIAVDELSVLPLKPLGDESDPLISAALFNIAGSPNTAARRSKVMPAKAYDSRQRVDENISGVLMKR